MCVYELGWWHQKGVWNAIPSVLVIAVMSQRVQRVFAAWSFETVRWYLDLMYFWYVSTVWCMQWLQQGWSAFMAYGDMWFWYEKQYFWVLSWNSFLRPLKVSFWPILWFGRIFLFKEQKGQLEEITKRQLTCLGVCVCVKRSAPTLIGFLLQLWGFEPCWVFGLFLVCLLSTWREGSGLRLRPCSSWVVRFSQLWV